MYVEEISSVVSLYITFKWSLELIITAYSPFSTLPFCSSHYLTLPALSFAFLLHITFILSLNKIEFIY